MADSADYLGKIEGEGSSEDLDAIEQELFGRKSGVITNSMKEIKDLSPEEKIEKAKELNEQKKKLTDAIENKRLTLSLPSDEELASKEKIDVSVELPEPERGHHHLVPEFMREIEEVFGRMGFDVFRGPEAESEDYNFNLLNIPEDHPARDTQDTFWIEQKGDETLPHARSVTCKHTNHLSELSSPARFTGKTQMQLTPPCSINLKD